MLRFSALVSTAVFALLSGTKARAQYEIAQYYSPGVVNLIGFDCTDPNNTHVTQMTVGQRLIVSLASSDFGPAGLAFSIGPAFPCPGIPLPGFVNDLLLDPVTILPFGFSTNLTAGRGGYVAWGYVVNVPQVALPATALGLTFTMQGIVTGSGNVPTFTRAIQITVV